jgi:hypothetical protein
MRTISRSRDTAAMVSVLLKPPLMDVSPLMIVVAPGEQTVGSALESTRCSSTARVGFSTRNDVGKLDAACTAAAARKDTVPSESWSGAETGESPGAIRRRYTSACKFGVARGTAR